MSDLKGQITNGGVFLLDFVVILYSLQCPGTGTLHWMGSGGVYPTLLEVTLGRVVRLVLGLRLWLG